MKRSWSPPYVQGTKHMIIIRRRLAALVLATALISGCSSMGVEPWDRDILAEDEMQLTTDAIEAATEGHSNFSKEASSGGRGFGGGGCGGN